MPYVNVDVEIDDFVDSCDKREKERLIDYLMDHKDVKDQINRNSDHPMELEFKKALISLSNSYHRLSNDDAEFIINISNKL